MCKFKTVEGAARAIRVLNKFEILNSPILIIAHNEESLISIKEHNGLNKGILFLKFMFKISINSK